MFTSSHSCYRKILKNHLEDRMGRNPLYSLRSFASDIRISPQMLSHVLRGRKNLSLRSANEVSLHLGLAPKDHEHFLSLVQAEKLRVRPSAKPLKSRVSKTYSKYKQIDDDVYRAISDWQHYAIMELSLTADFQSDVKWIAKRLGLKPFEVTQSVERMEKLGIFVRNEDGDLVRVQQNLSANFNAPNAAARKLALQFLEKACESLESQTQDERDLTNITMAIDPKLIPEAKEMIAKFRRKLCRFLESGERTEVYVFAPSLFKLSQSRRS